MGCSKEALRIILWMWVRAQLRRGLCMRSANILITCCGCQPPAASHELPFFPCCRSWVITWLFNCIFVAITLISFTQLWEASSIYLPTSGQNIYSDRTWRAPMASCILSALLVIGYDIMSCVTLIKCVLPQEIAWLPACHSTVNHLHQTGPWC